MNTEHARNTIHHPTGRNGLGLEELLAAQRAISLHLGGAS